MAKAVQRSSNLLGQEHPFTLISIYNLGLIRLEQGEWEVAQSSLQVVSRHERARRSVETKRMDVSIWGCPQLSINRNQSGPRPSSSIQRLLGYRACWHIPLGLVYVLPGMVRGSTDSIQFQKDSGQCLAQCEARHCFQQQNVLSNHSHTCRPRQVFI